MATGANAIPIAKHIRYPINLSNPGHWNIYERQARSKEFSIATNVEHQATRIKPQAKKTKNTIESKANLVKVIKKEWVSEDACTHADTKSGEWNTLVKHEKSLNGTPDLAYCTATSVMSKASKNRSLFHNTINKKFKHKGYVTKFRLQVWAKKKTKKSKTPLSGKQRASCSRNHIHVILPYYTINAHHQNLVLTIHNEHCTNQKSLGSL